MSRSSSDRQPQASSHSPSAISSTHLRCSPLPHSKTFSTTSSRLPAPHLHPPQCETSIPHDFSLGQTETHKTAGPLRSDSIEIESCPKSIRNCYYLRLAFISVEREIHSPPTLWRQYCGGALQLHQSFLVYLLIVFWRSVAKSGQYGERGALVLDMCTWISNSAKNNFRRKMVRRLFGARPKWAPIGASLLAATKRS